MTARSAEIAHARALRRDATPPERKLWGYLRTLRGAGFHFRRQAPFRGYVLDFVCHGQRLVIEVDGAEHGSDVRRPHDAVRDAVLTREGFRTLRFLATDVLLNLEGVGRAIHETLVAAPHPDPPFASCGEGLGAGGARSGGLRAMPLLSGAARLAGVIGWPVAHSRSPRLHNAWLERHGIDGAYLPLPVRPADFSAALRGLVACGFAGANVTIPHKEAAHAACDSLDEAARRAGAVNTLVFRDGRIHGSNTDGWGFVAHLRASGVDPAAGPALLLGAGGAARAIAVALSQEGVAVTLCNRTPERAAALAGQALVVNTTSLGMAGQPGLEMSLDRAAPGLAVADIVYVPLETPLLAAARARGLRAVDGLGMLLHQARPGFAAWFGVMPEVDAQVRDLLAADIPRR
jgi:shikimate dehydrogenase